MIYFIIGMLEFDKSNTTDLNVCECEPAFPLLDFHEWDDPVHSSSQW